MEIIGLIMGYGFNYRIAIVGFGPKGLYSFERLLAHLNTAPTNTLIEIHLFNKTGFFGAGDVYRTDQHNCLIMNYANQNINMWPSGFPKPRVGHTPDFSSWLRNKKNSSAHPFDFSPRSLVGEYLMDGYNSLIQYLPNNMVIFTHIGTVADVTLIKNRYKITWRDADTASASVLKCNQVLFTTGHTTFKSEKEEQVSVACKIEFIYPTHKKLKDVAVDSSVGLKGIGLTGMDAILALTEARGGSFDINEDSSHTYRPSGKEPKKIYPFSRTGLPMVPRNGLASVNTKLYYFTEKRMHQFKIKTSIDFEESLLPLIKKEFIFSFYSVLFINHGLQLLFDEDFQKVQNQITFFHQKIPRHPVFTWENLTDPFRGINELTTELIKEHLIGLLKEAILGEDQSPLMSALASWRKISPLFNQVYSYGGLHAKSHRKFDTYYFGLFNRLAYGPPIKNVKKLIALMDYGILDFSYAKSATVEQNKNRFQIIGRDQKRKTPIDYLINATIPKANGKAFKNELYRNLVGNGLIQPFENTVNGSYYPGCLSINTIGNPISKKGGLNSAFTFYGTPTEGITFDNNTLSRTRNNFASAWAAMTCKAIHESTGTMDNYEGKRKVL